MFKSVQADQLYNLDLPVSKIGHAVYLHINMGGSKTERFGMINAELANSMYSWVSCDVIIFSGGQL